MCLSELPPAPPREDTPEPPRGRAHIAELPSCDFHRERTLRRPGVDATKETTAGSEGISEKLQPKCDPGRQKQEVQHLKALLHA